MKKKTLAILVMLICSFALAPSMARADADDWYQGRRGHWIETHKEWRFRDADGNEYRRHGNSWNWYNGRYHSPAATAYHHRNPEDSQSFNQFKHNPE